MDIIHSAREACMKKDDNFLEVADFKHPVSPQNEAAALSSLLLKGNALDPRSRAELETLCSTYLERTGAHKSTDAEASTSVYSGRSKEASLYSWCKTQGLKSSVSPATFGNGLRGVQADTDLAAGEVAISMPVACLISYKTAADSDLGKALQRIPGLSEEAMAVVWTMIDRADLESTLAPYWASLPSSIGTALSVPEDQLESCLKGSDLLEEARQARQHIKEQYQALCPVLETLVCAYPQFVSRECVSWEAYMWAVEVWYAYAIQVQLHPSKQQTCPCLAPYIGLINHSAWPHAVHFSAVDPKTQMLNVRSFRPCKAGQQFYISYGPLPNEKLLLFYGFCLPGNPYDTACISLQDLDAEDLQFKERLLAFGLDVEHRLSSRSFVLPKQLLATARLLAMGPEEHQGVQQQQRQQKQQQQGKKGAQKKSRGMAGVKEVSPSGSRRGQSNASNQSQQCPAFLLNPVSEANERAAMQQLLHVIRRKLGALPAHTCGKKEAGTFAAAAEVYIQGQRQALHLAQAECERLLYFPF